MSASKLPPPIYITTPGKLNELAGHLARQPAVAVDTESNSLHAYQEQVCLIQFSTSDADYLVDPLALSDLTPLAPIFAGQEVEKIFHAAEYDVMCLGRDFGFEFANLFDTMLAARILGRKAVGLGSMLKAEFGVQLNKRHQRANWGQRPLPDHLLAYARLDTHYLIPLRDRLLRDLHATGRWALAQEDFSRVSRVEDRTTNNHQSCWRINGAHELDPQQAAVLQELCRFRDEVARRLDRPVFKVLHDRDLLAVAEACPQTEAQLGRVEGLAESHIRRYGRDLLGCVSRGLQARPIRPPRGARPTGAYLARVDALRNWRKNQARRMGVNSDVVLPRDYLHTIARVAPEDLQALTGIMEPLPWRLEQFGEEILGLLNRVQAEKR